MDRFRLGLTTVWCQIRYVWDVCQWVNSYVQDMRVSCILSRSIRASKPITELGFVVTPFRRGMLSGNHNWCTEAAPATGVMQASHSSFYPGTVIPLGLTM
jgi:hypothetical protein